MTLAMSRGTVIHFGARVVAGELGLAKTFWLFYFGVPLVWDLGIEVLSNLGLVITPAAFAVLQILLAVYVVPVTVGVHRAADQYKGNPAWALYAKVFSVLGVAVLAAVIFILLSSGAA